MKRLNLSQQQKVVLENPEMLENEVTKCVGFEQPKSFLHCLLGKEDVSINWKSIWGEFWQMHLKLSTCPWGPLSSWL